MDPRNIGSHEWGGGGEVSPRKSVVQSYCQCEVTFRVSDFQNREESVHRRDGKNIEFITEILF